MCLDRLVTFEVTKGYGWQVFGKRETGLIQLGYHLDRPKMPVIEGAWQTDSNTYSLRPSSGIGIYNTGFHILLEFEDAIDYLIESNKEVIRKVWFKDVVATGEQELIFICPARPAKVVVARKRYVERA